MGSITKFLVKASNLQNPEFRIQNPSYRIEKERMSGHGSRGAAEFEEMFRGETSKLFDAVEKEERGRKENDNRELKLRYLNSFSGLAAPNSDTSKGQKVLERLVNDPLFDVFFLSSSQFCSLLTNENQCHKNGRKN